MKKLLVLLPALLAAAPAIPCGATSGFCVCIRAPSVEAGLAAADAVFRGTVLEVEEAPPRVHDPANPQPWARTRIRVVESWKGVSAGTVSVHQIAIANCETPFRVGDEYVVYARRRSDGSLLSDSCTRGMAVTERLAGDELRELRRLTAATR
jgi:hypothetical protein